MSFTISRSKVSKLWFRRL